MEKRILIIIVFIVFIAYCLSGFSQVENCNKMYHFPEAIKKNIIDQSYDYVMDSCYSCDSLNTIYYLKYYSPNIVGDTILLDYSAAIRFHFIDTTPCAIHYIDYTQTYAYIYKIEIDSLLLVNVAESFMPDFVKYVPSCKFLLVNPCTRFTGPNFCWQYGKYYTAGVGVGCGYGDLNLYALYSDSAIIVKNKWCRTMEMQFSNYKELGESIIECLY